MPFRFSFNLSYLEIIFSVNSFDFRESNIKVIKYKGYIEFEVKEKPFVSEVRGKEKINDKFSCLIRSRPFIG